jgi:hypothetical protein
MVQFGLERHGSMIYEQSRFAGIVGCTVLGCFSIVTMGVVSALGQPIPPSLSTVAGVALGIIGTLVNTYTPERPGTLPPK